jgi:hypothetical protein
MQKRFFKTLAILFAIFLTMSLKAQITYNYNLVKSVQQNKLENGASQQIKVLDSAANPAISVTGIALLKDITLKDGVIDIDLRGKDIFLKSFLGIAFHVADTNKYEVIYFRPFRFSSTDTPTRKWSVQYMCIPGYDYVKLRKEHPGVYENSIIPVPGANDWFHATIVIKGEWITVYVNHSNTASLQVKTLSDNLSGKIGLWTSASSGDFANLSVKNNTDQTGQ